jgi:hypothetical protein
MAIKSSCRYCTAFFHTKTLSLFEYGNAFQRNGFEWRCIAAFTLDHHFNTFVAFFLNKLSNLCSTDADLTIRWSDWLVSFAW